MRALARCALVALSFVISPLAAAGCKPNGPCYAAEGIVNAASNLSESLAPFTWASIYGTALSYNTRARAPEDELPGFGGVNVLVNNLPALISYISPLQVNFLIPFAITTSEAVVQVTREGMAGPAITVKLSDCSPALFVRDADTAVAAHPQDPEHYTDVTPESPARAGEIIILYATGLGPLLQPLDDTEVPRTADPIARRNEFTLVLDGKPVEDRLIEYAGAAPGFIGVYQINLKLAGTIAHNPEIRIGLAERLSPPGIHLLTE